MSDVKELALQVKITGLSNEEVEASKLVIQLKNLNAELKTLEKGMTKAIPSSAQIAQHAALTKEIGDQKDRLKELNKIVDSAPLTSVFTWYFDSVAKTSHPKISGLDFADIYATCWQQTFHYIDKGKLFTLKMKSKPAFLSSFVTKLDTPENEGFRTLYKATIKNVEILFAIQKITSDGEMSEIECIIK